MHCSKLKGDFISCPRIRCLALAIAMCTCTCRLNLAVTSEKAQGNFFGVYTVHFASAYNKLLSSWRNYKVNKHFKSSPTQPCFVSFAGGTTTSSSSTKFDYDTFLKDRVPEYLKPLSVTVGSLGLIIVIGLVLWSCLVDSRKCFDDAKNICMKSLDSRFGKE